MTFDAFLLDARNCVSVMARFNLRESSIDFKYRSARAGSFEDYNALVKEKESFA
jgi:hypothetical protein